jgi:hypothetical protein
MTTTKHSLPVFFDTGEEFLSGVDDTGEAL